MISLTRSRRLASGVAAIAASAVCFTTMPESAAKQPNQRVTASADPTTEDTYSPMEEAVADVLAAHRAEQRVARVSGREALDESQTIITDEELQGALEANGATSVRIVADTADDEVVAQRGLPRDLFKVTGKWASWIQDRKQYIAFYGRWNYRNDVIGSGNPDDAAGITVKNFSDACWRNVSSGLKTQDQRGRLTNLRTRYEARHSSTIWSVHDDTSGFQLLTDMGFAWIEMRRDALGCDRDKQGRFYHEHNQEGSGVWTAGFNLLFFYLEYSRDGGQTLRKATAIKYFDYNEPSPS